MNTLHTFNPPLMTRFRDTDAAKVAVIAVAGDALIACYKYPAVAKWNEYALNLDGTHTPDDPPDSMAIVITPEIKAAIESVTTLSLAS